jgi:hypothetical protein
MQSGDMDPRLRGDDARGLRPGGRYALSVT